MIILGHEINVVPVACIIVIILCIGAWIYLYRKFSKEDNQNKSDDGVDIPSNEETKDSSKEHLETTSDKEVKKEIPPLSNGSLESTNQADKELQLERSAPDTEDNQPLAEAEKSMSDDGSGGHESGKAEDSTSSSATEDDAKKENGAER